MSTACGRPQEGGVKLMWTYVDTGRGLKNPDFPVNVKNRWPLSITLRPYNLGQHITTHARKHARKHIHRWTDVFVYRSVASSFFPNSRNSASLNSFDSDSFSASLGYDSTFIWIRNSPTAIYTETLEVSNQTPFQFFKPIFYSNAYLTLLWLYKFSRWTKRPVSCL